jgi:phenylpropionate dioxygenase-like ring-hydroxylating dioxygenase large terminal subunit
MNAPSQEAIDRYREAMMPFWHPVMRSCDLTDEPERVVLLDTAIVLARLDGQATAMDNVCRHLGAALNLGDVVDGRVLRCRYHGWAFDRTGHCVDIPLRRDGRTIPAQAKVRTFHCREEHGLVWVCLADEPVGDLPPYPEGGDPALHRNEIVRHEEWRASVPRLAMAALDDTHFSWVHPGTLGVPEQPEMPQRVGEEPVQVRDGVLTSRYRTHIPVNPMAVAAGGSDIPIATVEVEFVNTATVNSMKNVIFSDDGVSVTWNVYQPVSYDRTVSFTQLSRSYDKDPALDPTFEEFNLGIKEQDRAVVEAQSPWLLPPLAARMILYVRPEDVPLVEYQKMLERFGVPQI